MEGIEVHRYEITLNGELVGTAKDLTIAELIFDKKCQQLFSENIFIKRLVFSTNDYFHHYYHYSYLKQI